LIEANKSKQANMVTQRKSDFRFFRELMLGLEKDLQGIVAADQVFQTEQQPLLLTALKKVEDARQVKQDLQKRLNQLQKQQQQARKKHQADQNENGKKQEWTPDPAIKEQQQQLQQDVKAAEETENEQQKELMGVFRPILEQGIGVFSNKEHEEKIVKCALLRLASPMYLAKFCQEHGEEVTNLVWELLDDPDRMKQILLHGGPKDGKLGDYLVLHDKLQALIPDDDFTECHQRLAFAVALEHASPIAQLDTPDIFVDPVKRFQHYQTAHKTGELDPAFSFLSVWEYRMVVDCNATDEQIQWGRDYLRNFRPNQVVEGDRKWRYAMAVKTDVGYRKPNWTSRPKTYQQMVSGGGKCGPRAWYGRYICKAFGIPTWGVRQPGHAAATRWTPTGWVTLLGAGWQKSNWEGRCGVDFKHEAHARSFASEDEYFTKVILPECLSVALGENRKPIRQHGNYSAKCLWYCIGAAQRQVFARQATEEHFARDGVTAGPVKTQIEAYLEALEKKEEAEPKPQIEIINAGNNTQVVIPPAAFSGKQGVQKHRSFHGNGFQLMMAKEGSMVAYQLPESVEAGDYQVVVKVCNVHLVQRRLRVKINDDDKEYEIDVPYTIGEWKTTAPVKIALGANGNKFTLKRKQGGDGPCFGLAIKEIVLTKCDDTAAGTAEPEYVIVAEEKN
jgi:hypothetical protein